jgi:exonuclease III
MTIATWNIERPTKTTKRISSITACLKEINPDILILTETNEFIDLGNEYQIFHTSRPVESFYKEGERRASIFSKYNSVGQFETFRDDTSICIHLQTPFGNLAVYGTIIGINGNRRKNFNTDLDQQLLDFDSLAEKNNLCIGGDLNITFGDNYYSTEEGRKKLNASFEKNNLLNLTGKIPRNIDHIILTKTFVGQKTIKLHPWNLEPDKKLSDHMGVSVTIS